ncbi:unnamed protein product [Blepharisma stoltei]|uniref:Uncharacterized protein n=1 Tax=Blepharisma stoltei TaxID=1481888 RepID=A0AAU9J2Y7_9CILI|nr:unnamed protein product [Blepharisma stoltei]
MEYEDCHEEGLHFRRKRTVPEEHLPPSKRYPNEATLSKPINMPQPAKKSKIKCPDFPDLQLKLSSNFISEPSNTRVLNLLEDFSSQLQNIMKETYCDHPTLVNASLEMLDDIMINCKTELKLFNENKKLKKDEEIKINENMKHQKLEEEAKWKRINSLMRINPNNLKLEKTKLYIDRAANLSKPAYDKLKILDINIEEKSPQKFNIHPAYLLDFSKIPDSLKDKTQKNLTNVASYAEETWRCKKDQNRDKGYAVTEDFGPLLSVFFEDSRKLFSSFKSLKI